MPVSGNPPTPVNSPWYNPALTQYYQVLDANGQPGFVMSTDNGFYNFNPSQFLVWSKQLAKVRAGTADALISELGDSTTVGAGAGTGGSTNLTGARAKSGPAQFAAMMQGAIGVPGCNDSFWGAAGLDAPHTIAATTAYDPRVTAVVSGANEWGFTGIAAGQVTGLTERWWANNLGTGALTFVPTDTSNTMDYWYVKGSGKGHFTADIGGAALADVDSANGTTVFAKATFTTGAGAAANTWNLKRTGVGASITILGGLASNSAVRKVHVMNHGWFGAKSSDLATATQVYDSANAWRDIAAHLNFIDIGGNDIFNSISVAAWSSNVQTLITRGLVNGSVVLCFLTPLNPATRDPLVLVTAYLTEAKRLAVANNITLIDYFSVVFGSFAAANSAGLMYDDAHMLTEGYGIKEATKAALLRKIG